MGIIQDKKRLTFLSTFVACFSMISAITAQECNCGPRWTASFDSVFMTRSSAAPQPLVGNAPGGGATLYDAHDFNFDNQIAPRFTLRRHGKCGTDLEILYLNVNSIEASASVDTSFSGPNAGSILVGDGDVGLTTSPTLDPDLYYSSQLNSLEINCRHRTSEWVTLIAGFRWIEMDETYDWISNGQFGDFGRVHTDNDLYGFQVGSEVDIWSYCRFDVEGYTKVGIYANESNLTYKAQVAGPDLARTAEGNRTSFVGESALTGTFNFKENLSLRMGYQGTFLNGIAAATDQMSTTDSSTSAVNDEGSAAYHGPFIRLTFQR